MSIFSGDVKRGPEDHNHPILFNMQRFLQIFSNLYYMHIKIIRKFLRKVLRIIIFTIDNESTYFTLTLPPPFSVSLIQ